MKYIKLISILFLSLSVISIASAKLAIWNTDLAPLETFLTNENIPRQSWPEIIYIDKDQLPKMQALILTQDLLTPAIAQYYQRTPKIRAPLQIDDNVKENNYYRAILMVIDNDAKRDDALVADALKQSTVVELGLITINFSALPSAVINGVRQGEIPLGTLLVENKIETDYKNRRYFKMTCDAFIAQYLSCKKDHILYGRTNMLIRADNHAPFAQVVEILSGADLILSNAVLFPRI